MSNFDATSGIDALFNSFEERKEQELAAAKARESGTEAQRDRVRRLFQHVVLPVIEEMVGAIRAKGYEAGVEHNIYDIPTPYVRLRFVPPFTMVARKVGAVASLTYRYDVYGQILIDQYIRYPDGAVPETMPDDTQARMISDLTKTNVRPEVLAFMQNVLSLC